MGESGVSGEFWVTWGGGVCECGSGGGVGCDGMLMVSGFGGCVSLFLAARVRFGVGVGWWVPTMMGMGVL